MGYICPVKFDHTPAVKSLSVWVSLSLAKTAVFVFDLWQFVLGQNMLCDICLSFHSLDRSKLAMPSNPTCWNFPFLTEWWQDVCESRRLVALETNNSVDFARARLVVAVKLSFRMWLVICDNDMLLQWLPIIRSFWNEYPKQRVGLRANKFGIFFQIYDGRFLSDFDDLVLYQENGHPKISISI